MPAGAPFLHKLLQKLTAPTGRMQPGRYEVLCKDCKKAGVFCVD